VSLHALRAYLDQTYRQLLDVLHEMPRIAGNLDLQPDELPDFTIVSHTNEQLQIPIWRVLLRLSVGLHDIDEVQAIDASGFDRLAASRTDANRTNYTFEAMKTTILVDCETGAILDTY